MGEQWEFQVGDTGKTRDGRPYRVICSDRKSIIDPDEGLPLVVLVHFGDDEYTCYRQADGRYLAEKECGGDLMPPDRVLAKQGGLRVNPLAWLLLPGAQAVVVDEDGLGWAVESSDVEAGERQWQTEGEMMRLDKQFFTTSGHDWRKWIAKRPEGV